MTLKAKKLELFKQYRKNIIANYEAYYRGDSDGYCPHGTYVGGCGIDWMCGYCEGDQLSITEEAYQAVQDKIRRERKHAFQAIAEAVYQPLLRGICAGNEWLDSADRMAILEMYCKLDKMR